MRLPAEMAPALLLVEGPAIHAATVSSACGAAPTIRPVRASGHRHEAAGR